MDAKDTSLKERRALNKKQWDKNNIKKTQSKTSGQNQTTTQSLTKNLQTVPRTSYPRRKHNTLALCSTPIDSLLVPIPILGIHSFKKEKNQTNKRHKQTNSKNAGSVSQQVVINIILNTRSPFLTPLIQEKHNYYILFHKWFFYSFDVCWFLNQFNVFWHSRTKLLSSCLAIHVQCSQEATPYTMQPSAADTKGF